MRQTYSRKTYKQRQEARERLDQAVHRLYTECRFLPSDFFAFEHGNLIQEGTLVISRKNPQERYLVLHTWPDIVGNPYESTWKAICPPGREHFARAVCRAVQAFNGNGGRERQREEDRAALEATMIRVAVHELEVRARKDALLQNAVSEAVQ